VTDPTPEEILRRVQPIPTYRDHPATSPCDIEGVAPDGSVVAVGIAESLQPTLLLFLSADCLGCQELWHGTAELRRALPEHVRTVIVTRSPAHEDASAIARLAPADVATVMSSAAFDAYRVTGAPFMVVVEGGGVRTEGVAWGVAETGRATLRAMDGKA
jgi:hypothetical protein